MVTVYDYVLAVWLRLEASGTAPELLEGLREYLEHEYQVNKLELVEEESEVEGEITVSLQLLLSFYESQMDGDEPTEEAIGRVGKELRSHLETRYCVNHCETMDDALTSYLLAVREEPELRKYPEPKLRDLTVDEKQQLRGRIESGDADVYALAREFGCSSSQVAGIKAAMKR